MAKKNAFIDGIRNAAKLIPPVVLGTGGAVLGMVLAARLAARSDSVASSPALSFAVQAGGMLAGASLPQLALKRGGKVGEQAFRRATLPVGIVGGSLFGLALMYGPRLYNAIADKVGGGEVAQLPEATAPLIEMQATGAASYAPAPAALQRAGGLSPAEWDRLTSRAAGMAPAGARSRWAA